MQEDLDARQDRIDDLEGDLDRYTKMLEEDDLTESERTGLQTEIVMIREELQQLRRDQASLEAEVQCPMISIQLSEVLRYQGEGPSLTHVVFGAFGGFFGYAIPALVASLISLFFVIPYIIVGVITYLITRKLVQRFIHKK